MSSDPYAVLGVSPTASSAEIRQAWIRKTRVLHPDRFDRAKNPEEWGWANSMLQEVNAAYDILKRTTPGAQRGAPPPQASAPRPRSSPPPKASSPPPPKPSPTPSRQKSRTAYILLAITLGWVGAHSFYAGYKGKGFTQLALTLFNGHFPAGPWIAYCWALYDAAFIGKDVVGIPMRSAIGGKLITLWQWACKDTDFTAWLIFGGAVVGTIFSLINPVGLASFIPILFWADAVRRRIDQNHGKKSGHRPLLMSCILFGISAFCVLESVIGKALGPNSSEAPEEVRRAIPVTGFVAPPSDLILTSPSHDAP